jgi:N-acetylneuraminic acid mutarotase
MVTDTWSAMSPSPLSARSKMAYTKVGNELMVWGGHDGSYVQDGALYNPETDTWRSISTTGAPAGRAHAFMAATNSEVLVWGGDAGLSPLGTGGLYHPETDNWSTTFTNSPSARTELSGVSLGDEIIIHGGYDGGNTLNTGARIKP